jgi:hypothetical protein
MYCENIKDIPRVRENSILDFLCVQEIMKYAPEYMFNFF